MILSAPDPAADPYFAAALLDLQHAAFAIEAELVGSRRLPPLLEDVVDLTAFRGCWVMAWDGTTLVGAAAWQLGDVAEIVKVMVHPEHHRRGIAGLLMTEVIARSPGRDLVVATGRDNPPGIALYSKHGFVAEGDEEVEPGLWIRRMRRSA